MKQFITKYDSIKIACLFIVWRSYLVVVAIVSERFLPLAQTDKLLGGGPKNFPLSPGLFSWANFDGEHYLSIAIFGYKSLEQAFFPLFPMIISFFARPFWSNQFSTLLSSIFVGLLISNSAFLLALIFLYELISLDFSKKVAFTTILVFLIFPTSFYFGAVYNESLFLLLSVLCFYFFRKRNFFMTAFFGILAAATRIFGVLLLPALLIDVFRRKEKFSKIFWIFLIPLGLVAYMWYQYLTVGDAFAFYHLQEIVGEQHQYGLVLLPQVYYRYTKMLLTVNIQNPIYQTILLEMAVGISFFLLPIYGFFKKIRWSYLFYALAGFIAPTIQGSFSSVPRYVIVFFPSFLAITLFLNNRTKLLKTLYFFVSLLLLTLETALFIRGYWVA